MSMKYDPWLTQQRRKRKKAIMEKYNKKMAEEMDKNRKV